MIRWKIQSPLDDTVSKGKKNAKEVSRFRPEFEWNPNDMSLLVASNQSQSTVAWVRTFCQCTSRSAFCFSANSVFCLLRSNPGENCHDIIISSWESLAGTLPCDSQRRCTKKKKQLSTPRFLHAPTLLSLQLLQSPIPLPPPYSHRPIITSAFLPASLSFKHESAWFYNMVKKKKNRVGHKRDWNHYRQDVRKHL